MQKLSKTITLNNGLAIPTLGFGVYQVPKKITEQTVLSALEAGYRLIDTAAFYGNEKEVGKAIRKSAIPRDEIFVTTKLHPLTFFHFEKAFYKSLERLGFEYIDLYLIHWPFLKTPRVWKTLETIYERGHAKAIGVSNYMTEDLERLLQYARVTPAVNQIEFNPFRYDKELLNYCTSKDIVIEAHSPLTHGKLLNHPVLKKLAEGYAKSPAQILLRWGLQHGVVPIPKTTRINYMRENTDIFNFEMNQEDMVALNGLNKNFHAAGMTKILDLIRI